MADLHIDYDSIAEIYDLYATWDHDFSFFLSEVATVEGPVLEVTSGTGRLSLPLARAGARLTCVDISHGMLAVLSRKLEREGLEADIVCTDLCELRLPKSFPMALLPFQAFMELVGESRQRRALAAIHACLVDRGRFICTMHNPVIRRRQVDGALRLVGHFSTPEGMLVVSGFERGGDPVVSRLQLFEHFDRDGVLREKKILPMEFAFVEKSDFEKMAVETGFRVVELFGNYDRSPFDALHSPVMIWVLEK